MYERILVPLDGSELAETALEPAATIAQHQGGELILASVSAHKHVIAPGAAGYGPVILDGRDRTRPGKERGILEQHPAD